MIKLVVKEANEGEFETLCTREYEPDSFTIPEPRNVVTIPDDDADEAERYYVQNIIHQLDEDQPEIQLIVESEEEVMRQMRQQRAQRMKQMQQMQGGGGGGGGNPFGGGDGGGGEGGGSPFSL